MEPITMMVIVLVAAAVAVAAWPWLCDYFQCQLIPYLRDRFSADLANSVADLIVFLDGKATPTRALFAKGWRALTRSVLGLKTTYKKTSAAEAVATTEQYLHNDGRVVRVVHEEQLSWADIPSEIRSQMIKQQADAGTLDQLQVVEEQARKVAEEHAMLDLVAIG